MIGVDVNSVFPTLRRQRENSQKFKARLSYTGHSRPTWAT